MTFWCPAKKLKSEPGLRENPVEAVPGSQNRSKFDAFSEGLSGGSFFRSRRLKKAAKADFRPNWADSGLPFGPTFGLIWHFLGGLQRHAFLVDF